MPQGLQIFQQLLEEFPFNYVQAPIRCLLEGFLSYEFDGVNLLV